MPFCGKIWPMRALETVTSGRFCASKHFLTFLIPKTFVFLQNSRVFRSFQSEIILVKCCKEVSATLKLVFFPNFPCLSRNIFVCKFVYIFRTDENPFGSCQPCSNNIHITYDDNTAAHRATCAYLLRNLPKKAVLTT